MPVGPMLVGLGATHLVAGAEPPVLMGDFRVNGQTCGEGAALGWDEQGERSVGLGRKSACQTSLDVP